jgi:hypothetical protein
MTLPPIPADPPISGPLWTLVVPAALVALTFLATWLLYRRFAREVRRRP